MAQNHAYNPDITEQEWLDGLVQDLLPDDRQRLIAGVQWLYPLIKDAVLPTEEGAMYHAKGAANLLSLLQMDGTTLLTAMIVSLPLSRIHQPEMKEQIIEHCGVEVWQLVEGVCTLVDVSLMAREQTRLHDEDQQQERLRKMLLAMATDLRIVLIRLCSRLQTLRWYASSKLPCPQDIARETRYVYAPLANRLGIWQIKWELEDLSFRFLEPEKYREIARKLEVKRTEREQRVNRMIEEIQKSLRELHICDATVVGRAKHIYSIYNKMQMKNLAFEELYDLQALRIIVENERDCYTALSMVHTHWTPVIKEYDDYIAKPKPNGYRSLHTVVQDQDGFIFEVQIRTQEMHRFAEYGMAAHWRYKEAGRKGGQVSASSLYDRQIAWMRQLIAWRQEAGVTQGDQAEQESQSQLMAQEKNDPPVVDDKIYVLTPQARVIELVNGSTPIDFAYSLHTDLGHRCRGAKVNGHLVALNKKLQTGQTVEIIAAKSGGPSRDWLNPELGYIASTRAKTKVRMWFNAIELQNRITQGQEIVEKELQRLGKTSANIEQLAAKLGYSRTDDLYIAIAKDEISLRAIGQSFVEPESKEYSGLQEGRVHSSNVKKSGKSGVLVVGVDSLLTQLAGCCHPAPPDAIGGFITTGRGVSIHRRSCPAFQALECKSPERIIEVDWGQTQDSVYPVQLCVRARDRGGLLRDISELFARLKLNVISVNTQTRQSNANMHFTVEVQNAEQIGKALHSLKDITGVFYAERV